MDRDYGARIDVRLPESAHSDTSILTNKRLHCISLRFAVILTCVLHLNGRADVFTRITYIIVRVSFI